MRFGDVRMSCIGEGLAAIRRAAPWLLPLLPAFVSLGGVSSMHYLAPQDREWLRTASALAVLAAVSAVPVRRRPSSLGGALGATVPGFVLPLLARYW